MDNSEGPTTSPGEKGKRISTATMDQLINVYIWDMDETLILLKSLLNGEYAKAFTGSKDVEMGKEIGKKWEDQILQVCDEYFFYEQYYSQSRTQGRFFDYQHDNLLLPIKEQLDRMPAKLDKLEARVRGPMYTSLSMKPVESSQRNNGKVQEQTSILAIARTVKDKVELNGLDEWPNLVACPVSLTEEIIKHEQLTDTLIKRDVKAVELLN